MYKYVCITTLYFILFFNLFIVKKVRWLSTHLCYHEESEIIILTLKNAIYKYINILIPNEAKILSIRSEKRKLFIFSQFYSNFYSSRRINLDPTNVPRPLRSLKPLLFVETGFENK